MSEFNVSEVLAAYMRLLERTRANEGLGINALLGFPGAGRTEPALPCAALVFATDDYVGAGQRPTPRLGQVPPSGTGIVATLYLIARNEPELLGLIDAMRTVKAQVASVTAGTQGLVVRYGPTQRVDLALSDRVLEYVVATSLSFSVR